MVSSAIPMELDELVERLRRIRKQHSAGAEYKAWRKNFPKSWPM